MHSGIVMWSHNPTNNTTAPYWSDVLFLTSWGLGLCVMRGDWPPTFEVEYRNLDPWSASLGSMGRSCWNDDHFIPVLSWLEKHHGFFWRCPAHMVWKTVKIYVFLCSWDFSWDFLLWNMIMIRLYIKYIMMSIQYGLCRYYVYLWYLCMYYVYFASVSVCF